MFTVGRHHFLPSLRGVFVYSRYYENAGFYMYYLVTKKDNQYIRITSVKSFLVIFPNTIFKFKPLVKNVDTLRLAVTNS